MCEEFEIPKVESLVADGAGPAGLPRWTKAEVLDYMSSMIRELRELAEGTRDESLAALLTFVQCEVDRRGRRCARRD